MAGHDRINRHESSGRAQGRVPHDRGLVQNPPPQRCRAERRRFWLPLPKRGGGTVFRGCRAWWNSDDGYDLFKQEEPVIIEDCWSMGAGCTTGGGRKPPEAGFPPAFRHPAVSLTKAGMSDCLSMEHPRTLGRMGGEVTACQPHVKTLHHGTMNGLPRIAAGAILHAVAAAELVRAPAGHDF